METICWHSTFALFCWSCFVLQLIFVLPFLYSFSNTRMYNNICLKYTLLTQIFEKYLLVLINQFFVLLWSTIPLLCDYPDHFTKMFLFFLSLYFMIGFVVVSKFFYDYLFAKMEKK